VVRPLHPETARPPSGALTLGSAVHAAINANMEQKVETKQDRPPAGVKAVYDQAWDLLVKDEYPARYQGGKPSLPTEFRDDEEPGDLKKQGEVLTLKYLDEACPEIEPKAVEFPVSGSINGVRVRGFIDLLDAEGRVIDLKTAARTPSEISSDYRFQVATYRQLLGGIVTGQARVDTLVKTKTPKLVQMSCTIDQSDIDSVNALYPVVQRGIRGGFFAPNRSHYLCSRKYCGFWRECQRQFGGKVSE